MTVNRKLMIGLVGVALALGLAPAAAQDDDAPAGFHQQSQDRSRLREQVRERIAQDPSLDAGQRDVVEGIKLRTRIGLAKAQPGAPHAALQVTAPRSQH